MTALATEYVEKIESLQQQIKEVYSEVRRYDGGHGHASVIADAVRARAELREAEFIAEGYLESFDAEIADANQSAKTRSE